MFLAPRTWLYLSRAPLVAFSFAHLQIIQNDITARSGEQKSGQEPEAEKVMRVLICCEDGDLDHLKELLANASTPDPLPSAHDMYARACKGKQPQVVRFLNDRYPDLVTTVEIHKAAFSAGVEVYGIVLDKHPTMKEQTFGHTSDPISEAVLKGDIKMLDFLFARGFDAKDSHYCYVLVS